MTLTHVLQPIDINGCTIKNRVVRTAHATGLGPMNDALIAYHAERAAGGVGLTILEILSVHPTSPASLNSFDPSLPDQYGKLIDACRPHGMKLFQQIWHGGHNAVPLDGSPPWSASDIASPTIGMVPLAMTKDMIAEIIASYRDAVAKCVAWGLDGAEIHCAHGYLPAQFLSPASNQRTDEYGGDLDGRIRFALELLAACRAETRPGFALGIRVAPDLVPGGADIETNLALAKEAEKRGLIDFVDVSLGNYHSFPKMIGGMHEPAGYEMPTSEPITHAISVPTIVTGRFRTLEEADQVIRSGDADLVGLTRAHIADPALVRKTIEQGADAVRPCIACNQGCVGNLLGPRRRMECAVNPGAGFETTTGDHMLQPAEEARRVLVIGGGPAGLEAARVAATRGHKVTLMEAAPQLGGMLRLAAQAPTRGGFLDILVWLEQEVYRLGVDVQLSTYVEYDDLDWQQHDHILIATGALPRMDGRTIANPGQPVTIDDMVHVSSLDVMLEPQNFADRDVVVVDDVGHYESLAVTETLLAQNARVTLVCRHASITPLMESALMAEPALTRLSAHPVHILQRHTLSEWADGEVELRPAYPHADGAIRKVRADHVVLITPNRPQRDLADSLQAAGISARLIGDANSPRYLQQAMQEGHLAAATI